MKYEFNPRERGYDLSIMLTEGGNQFNICSFKSMSIFGQLTLKWHYSTPVLPDEVGIGNIEPKNKHQKEAKPIILLSAQSDKDLKSGEDKADTYGASLIFYNPTTRSLKKDPLELKLDPDYLRNYFRLLLAGRLILATEERLREIELTRLKKVNLKNFESHPLDYSNLVYFNPYNPATV
jgi:hypothetical protein